MAINKGNSFGWLKAECESIKSNRFHIFEPLTASEQQCYIKDDVSISLRGSYSVFLREFGYAKFFTDQHDAPSMSVYPLKYFRRHVCKNGEVYVGFGFRGQQSVFFDESAILNGEHLKVFVVNGKTAREVANDFSDWLFDAYSWIKSKYSIKKWLRIEKGPEPFSASELKIVEEREKFHWELMGFDEQGNALFCVKNDSAITLPYLSVGIRDRDGAILTGGAYLNIAKILPGECGIVSKDCYKDKIPADKLEVFELPEPIPEKKARYWEFGVPD